MNRTCDLAECKQDLLKLDQSTWHYTRYDHGQLFTAEFCSETCLDKYKEKEA